MATPTNGNGNLIDEFEEALQVILFLYFFNYSEVSRQLTSLNFFH